MLYWTFALFVALCIVGYCAVTTHINMERGRE